jgi:hypothetical protein
MSLCETNVQPLEDVTTIGENKQKKKKRLGEQKWNFV